MEKIELQDIINACEAGESEYIKLYRPLLGYEDEITLYRGIDDSMEDVLNQIEDKVGIAFPGDFLQIYLLSNGGKYFDLKLYSLTTDVFDQNGLYAINFDQNIRKNYNIPADALIIGETKENEFLIIRIDEDGYYSYCMWDKEEKTSGVEFSYLTEILVYEIDYYTQAFSVDEE